MGLALTQVITEDRSSGAQVIDGSLKFEGNEELTFTPTSNGNTKTATWSFWVKRHQFGANDTILGFGPNNTNDAQIYCNSLSFVTHCLMLAIETRMYNRNETYQTTQFCNCSNSQCRIIRYDFIDSRSE